MSGPEYLIGGLIISTVNNILIFSGRHPVKNYYKAHEEIIKRLGLFPSFILIVVLLAPFWPIVVLGNILALSGGRK